MKSSIIKKGISVFLVLLALISCCTPFAAAKSDAPYISDVYSDKWYYSQVTTAYLFGLMDLTGQNLFSPDATAKRYEVVYGLWRIVGSPVIKSTNPFTDINSNQKYYNAVQWAYVAGITSGTSKITFSPDGTVTREQMCCFLKNFYSHCGIGNTKEVVKAGDASYLNGFDDKQKVADWAKDGVIWAVKNKVMSGKSKNSKLYIAPQNKTTRAELATFLVTQAEYHDKEITQYFDQILGNNNTCAIYFRASKIEALRYLNTAIYELMEYMRTKSKNSAYYSGSPWCCAFVYYCADQNDFIGTQRTSGQYFPFGPEKLASCPISYSYFESVGYLLDKNQIPYPGDLIYFKSNGISHIGIVVFADNYTGKVYTIEGNTYNAKFGVRNALGYCTYSDYHIGSPAWSGATIYAYARPFN